MESDKFSLRISKFRFKKNWIRYISPLLFIEIAAAFLPLAVVMVQKRELFAESNLFYLVGTGTGLSIASDLIKV